MDRIALELVQEICSFIELSLHPKEHRGKLGRLRLINRRFDAAVQPLLFSTLVIDFSLDRISKSIRQLNALSSDYKPCPARRFAKFLYIYQLDPAISVRKTTSISWGQFKSAHTVEVSGMAREQAKYLKFKRIMGKSLFKALSSLGNLRTISWCVFPPDPVSPVSKVLCGLPHLEAIDVTFASQFLPHFPLDSFSNLKTVSVALREPHPFWVPTLNDGASIVNNLAEVVRTSPQITRIAFQIYQSRTQPTVSSMDMISLGDIIPISSRVEEIVLTGCRFNLPKPSRHMAFLTALDVQLCDAASQTSLWSNLQQGSIRLTHLTTDLIPETLLTYLASFTGLESLQLRQRHPGTALEFETFFHSSLSPHQDTLQKLSFYDPRGVDWSLSPNRYSAILNFHALIKLEVAITSIASTSAVVDVGRFLMAMTALKHLKELEILTFGPGARVRLGVAATEMITQAELMAQNIANLTIEDDPGAYPFRVYTKDRVFRLVESGLGGGYRYVGSRRSPFTYHLPVHHLFSADGVWQQRGG